MKTNNYIKEIDQTLRKSAFAKTDITYVMTQFRLLIEDNNLQEKYKFLNLYCNWTLHSKISESKTAYRILELITDSLISHNKDPQNSKWLNDAIIEGLSLHKLLEDIIDIGQEYDITETSKFADLNSWKIFAKILVDVLVERPLNFPSPITNSAKPIYDSVMKKAEDSGHKDENAVIGIQFVYPDEFPTVRNYQLFTLSSKAKNIKIIGPIAFINQDLIDKVTGK